MAYSINSKIVAHLDPQLGCRTSNAQRTATHRFVVGEQVPGQGAASWSPRGFVVTVQVRGQQASRSLTQIMLNDPKHPDAPTFIVVNDQVGLHLQVRGQQQVRGHRADSRSLNMFVVARHPAQ